MIIIPPPKTNPLQQDVILFGGRDMIQHDPSVIRDRDKDKGVAGGPCHRVDGLLVLLEGLDFDIGGVIAVGR